MVHGAHRPDAFELPVPPAEGRVVGARIAPPTPRHGRPWGRALALAGVVAVCLVPATDALASSRSEHGGRAPRAGVQDRRGDGGNRVRTVTRTVTAPTTPSLDPVSGGTGTGEEPVVRSGEDLGWWPWGPVVSGRLNRPVRGGYSTLVLQRGRIAAVTDSTVTLTSADGVTITWTVDERTRVLRPGGRGRAGGSEPRRQHARDTAPSPTDGSAGPTSSAPAPTAGLSAGEQVGIWGTASGDVTTATFVVVRSNAPAPSTSTSSPTSTPTETTSTSTSTSSTTSGTTSTDPSVE